MKNRSITKDEINELPIIRFQGKMHVITHREDCLNAIDTLRSKNILGFDTETRPAYRKGVEYKISLLQLSTNENAYLFRLNKLTFVRELQDLLANTDIIKAGVAVRDDIKGLRKLSKFEPGHFIEIADLAKKLNIKQLGLRSLAAILLDRRVSKQFKLTNWELPELSEEQLRYAATDAWIGLQLYNKISAILKQESQL